MKLPIELHTLQCSLWPKVGQHILACQDADTVWVYQAYAHPIADYAVEHQRFGGPFSFNRMSWIKPNFLWMMYRSGWASKVGQERVLAVQLPRPFFDEILAAAVPSAFDSSRFADHEAWKVAGESGSVRLQWDPDHAPNGTPLERRAIQLGLRGEVLARYATTELRAIEDITLFVHEQARILAEVPSELRVPKESIYLPKESRVSEWIGLSAGQPRKFSPQ